MAKPFKPDPNFLCAGCTNLAGGTCYQLRAIQDARGLAATDDPQLTSCGRYSPSVDQPVNPTPPASQEPAPPTPEAPSGSPAPQES